MTSAKQFHWLKFAAILAASGWMNLSGHAVPLPANLPLYFEAGSGQTGATTQFIAHGSRSEFLISPDAAKIILARPAGKNFATRGLEMKFAGANPSAQISGAEELSSKINYLIGNNPEKWKTGVPTFGKISIANIYPGINLIYYGNQRQLEYDLTVAPGANPDSIAIQFSGAEKISISTGGELILKLGNDEILQPKPIIYQTVHGEQKEISGGYKILDSHTVGFFIGNYNRNLPLVIDPILSYSTYFGGSLDDFAWKVAVDTNGFIYMAGETLSAHLATSGAFQTNLAGSVTYGDAFVAKFGNAGTNLVYCTYLGGSQDDAAFGLAVNSAGNVFLTGETDSPDFPTNNAICGAIAGPAYYQSKSGINYYYGDTFVSELDPTGSHLMFSTYLGGTYTDVGTSIALDSSGNAYVAGYTTSANFPTTNALIYQLSGASNVFNHLAGSYNAFLAKIAPGGTNLLYSTYFGGTAIDRGQSVAVDSSNYVYLAGFTDSQNFPIYPTNNPIQSVLGGVTNNPVITYDAFVAKFMQPTATNLQLVYSTFLGGTNDDLGYSIAVDNSGDAFVAGSTESPNFPGAATNFPGLFNYLTNNQSGSIVTTNAFVTEINSSGTAILNSAVFGGSNDVDIAYGVAVDTNNGDIFVVGSTASTIPTNFPTINATSGLAATNAGGSDAFIIAFNNNISGVIYLAMLGGSGNDYGYGVAIDPLDNAYIVGQTASANFPTNGAIQNTLSGSSDAFLAKIFLNPPLLSLSLNGGHANLAWNSGLPFEPELMRLFQLESSTNLSSTNWTPVADAPILSNNWYSLVFNPTNQAGFFRMRPVR